MKNFESFNLPESLLHTLTHLQFHTPTPIQVEAIPAALEGRDILGSAQTGTGKTGAFGIPLVTKLLTSPHGTALVMTPTRELAVQVMQQLQNFLGRKSKINTAVLIGGDSMGKQLQALRKKPRLIVGTPGRINDHLDRGTLKLSDTQFLVLDETDRMLDMGFSIQIEEILKYLPEKRQTMLFSATLPSNIQKISKKYLNDPVRIAVGQTSAVAANIKQEVVRTAEKDKYDHLLTQLNDRTGSVIMFMKTKYSTERMASKLDKNGFKADAIHGDLRQTKRDRVIAAFRKEKFRVLVATDVAARGLDIPHIEHVINYDLPQCAEDYVHRIGRTARAGAEGSALCFVTPADGGKWKAIERLLDPNAKPSDRSNESRPQGRNRSGKSFGFKKKGYQGNSDRPNRSDRSSNSERSERSYNSDRPNRSDRSSNSERSERSYNSDRPNRSDRSSNSERSERSYNSDRPNRSDRPNNADFSKKKRAFGNSSNQRADKPSFFKHRKPKQTA